MTELKTLKDLQGFQQIIYLKNKDIGYVTDKRNCADIAELKAEAIKDIKEFWRGHLPKELWGLTKENKEGIQAYIKWKMNLTEEDLQ